MAWCWVFHSCWFLVRICSPTCHSNQHAHNLSRKLSPLKGDLFKSPPAQLSWRELAIEMVDQGCFYYSEQHTSDSKTVIFKSNEHGSSKLVNVFADKWTMIMFDLRTPPTIHVELWADCMQHTCEHTDWSLWFKMQYILYISVIIILRSYNIITKVISLSLISPEIYFNVSSTCICTLRWTWRHPQVSEDQI